MSYKTIIEPFRIHSVEPIRMTTREQRAAARLAKVQARGDYGLLVPVATVRMHDDAALLRAVLMQAGIRGTVAEGPVEGERVVLVFRADAERARGLVSS